VGKLRLVARLPFFNAQVQPYQRKGDFDRLILFGCRLRRERIYYILMNKGRLGMS
jgi:hypothetical protein